jgi:DNA-binding transcriptional LysR family regulator
MREPTLADARTFLAVARHRSFRLAADELGVSPSTLSHIVAATERALGLRLFHRTTRSVALTEAGERLLARLVPAVVAFDDAFESLNTSRDSPTGTVRINAPEVAARLLLSEVVPVVLARYPELSVDLSVDGRLIDVVDSGFDAGVRLGESVPRDMVAVRFGGDVRFLVVGSPGYLRDHPAPATPEELESHECIRHRLPSGKLYRWEFERHGQEVEVGASGRLTLDTIPLMVEAAASGHGLAYVPDRAVRDRLEQGALVAVLEEWCPAIPGLVLYYAGHRHPPSPLRAFIDVLREMLP